MSIPVKQRVFQTIPLVALLLALSACGLVGGDPVINPPSTPPLSRNVVGYGVVTASYTHILDKPDATGVSLGYFRKGTIVKVLERRSISNGTGADIWLLVAGSESGWLKEEFLEVYPNEAKAKTAAAELLK